MLLTQQQTKQEGSVKCDKWRKNEKTGIGNGNVENGGGMSADAKVCFRDIQNLFRSLCFCQQYYSESHVNNETMCSKVNRLQLMGFYLFRRESEIRNICVSGLTRGHEKYR